MKHFLLIAFLLTCGCLFSQTAHELINGFKIDEKNMIHWQKVYETDLTRDELLAAIVESGFYRNVSITRHKVICELKPYQMNYNQYGFSATDVTYISQNLVTGTVVFELKDNKYKTSIKNIKFIQNSVNASETLTTLEFHVLSRNQDIKFNMFENGSYLLNKDFITRTTFERVNSR